MSAVSRVLMAGLSMLFITGLMGGNATGPIEFALGQVYQSSHGDIPTPTPSRPAGGPAKGPTVRMDTEAQLRGELSTPADFKAKDWATQSTTSGTNDPSSEDSCNLEFGEVNFIAGMTLYASRTLFEDSTTHQVIESLGDTPNAQTVIVQERQSLAMCASTQDTDDGKNVPVVFVYGLLAPASVGIAEGTPALCRTLTASSKDTDYDFGGYYCTTIVGDHVIQTREVTSDPTHPVTQVGFASILASESYLVEHQ